MTRREVIVKGGALGATLLVPGAARSAWEVLQGGAYGPFKMGIQSYSLRGYDLDTALAKTQELGLKYWEAFQAHVGQTSDPAALKPVLDKIKKAGIQLKVWGVQGFGANEEACRKIFEFGKIAGLDTISADPSYEAMPILDRLTKEFRINIAIHNHGPGARYDKLDSMLKAFEGTNERVGACIDTGHALRSGEDPVEWVKKLGKRVHALHLKDVKDRTQWKLLGQGDLRMGDLFAELKRQRFSGYLNLEYEEKPENPMDDIKECLAAVRKTLGRG